MDIEQESDFTRRRVTLVSGAGRIIAPSIGVNISNGFASSDDAVVAISQGDYLIWGDQAGTWSAFVVTSSDYLCGLSDVPEHYSATVDAIPGDFDKPSEILDFIRKSSAPSP